MIKFALVSEKESIQLEITDCHNQLLVKIMKNQGIYTTLVLIGMVSLMHFVRKGLITMHLLLHFSNSINSFYSFLPSTLYVTFNNF